MGKLADHKWSPRVERAVVGLYSRAYDVDLADCARKENFASFDDFFTRTLKDDARPIDASPNAIVSPADGRLDAMGSIDERSTFFVKGRDYRVAELVGSEEEAARYAGGVGCVVYLSPRDYHRVHSPVDGTIREIRSLPGDYFPVNSIGLNHVGNLFAINRRVAIAIDTPRSTGLGRVTVVMVAAIVVGRITVTAIDAHDVPLGTHALDVKVSRGDEIGIFHLGSTAVVFVEASAHARFTAHEGAVRLGERIALATHHENGVKAKVIQ